MDIGGWLRGLGLERYEQAFRNNEIDWALLPKLTADDLKDLGVTLVGHRRKLLEAIAELSAAGAPPEPIPSTAPSGGTAGADAERRQLTVMFCDLVGSTPLSTRFDPEDLREIVGAYHRCVADTVARCGGFVAKYMGDGVLIYFGYPEAHEDDAERAARAGLAIIDAVGGLATQEPLNVRIGIATGLVVVGDLIGAGAAQERGVVGETPNLAARLQALARPGTLVIADSTRRQLGTLFEIEDLGPQPLAGFAEPQRAWRVVGEGGVVSRFEALRSGTTPLVGRDEELDLLLRRWEQAKLGEGRVVFIAGEPGIGKSRMTAELSQRLADEPHTRLRYFCSPHHQDSPLHPCITQLEHAAGFSREDGAKEKLEKLKAALAPGAPSDNEFALLAELLSLPSAVADLNLSPQRKREMLFAALLHRLAALAARQPVLFLCEDLHWIDPSSRELLDRTIERAAHLPVLLIATHRPEFAPPWSGLPQVTMMSLARLDRRAGTAMVERIAGNTGVDRDLVEEIVTRADGVPLFVEELTKAMLEAGESGAGVERTLAGALPSSMAVPSGLHAPLMARLDRLGPGPKEVAQIAAAIGREFSYQLLAPVANRGESDLTAALGRLGEAGLVFARGTPPAATYQFKHALVRDAAYASLLRRRREELHARIARVLESDFPDIAEAQPELLAQHFTEAGLAEQAVTYCGKAAHRYAARSAMAEAAAHFQMALDQLALIPDSSQRQRKELEFCSALGAALRFVRGQAAPEIGEAFTRARKLWEQLGFPTEYIHVPYGQSRYHVYRGETDVALRLDEDLLNVSRQRNDSRGLILSHQSCGSGYLMRGRFALSRSLLETVSSLYNPAIHDSLGAQTGSHPHVVAEGILGVTLLCLGFPDQAVARTNAAIAEARRLAYPPTLASTLMLSEIVLSLAGDNEALKEPADELVTVASEQGVPWWGTVGTIYRGWVKAKIGEVTEGISLLRSGLAAYRASGAELWMPHHAALLAKAHDIAGQTEEALSALDDALQIAGRTGERWLEAELHRHKGQLLRRHGHTAAAEELYRKALSVSDEQEAKLWQLRAATSLARLWGEHGRRGEARELLAPLYGWFTEGFDTADLKEAKALLDQLG